ncbi:MAG TPA: hypothetical protein VFW18_01130 [Gaiellales bacterium]|nr:hypothetical protein [Gaiellales bacterium]
MGRIISRQLSVLVVLLCLQVAASMIALRRDPVDQFRAAAISGLVWVGLRRVQRQQQLPG